MPDAEPVYLHSCWSLTALPEIVHLETLFSTSPSIDRRTVDEVKRPFLAPGGARAHVPRQHFTGSIEGLHKDLQVDCLECVGRP